MRRKSRLRKATSVRLSVTVLVSLTTLLLLLTGTRYYQSPGIRQLELAQRHPRHIPCNPNNRNQSCVTLVTAFFLLGRCRHGLSEYETYIENFLARVETPIVIFTQPALQHFMEALRHGKPTYFVIYDEVWDIPWLNQPEFLYHAYHELSKIDPQLHMREFHSPVLYALWNSKPWMLQTAAELNPFNSTYFFWMDIGGVRNNTAMFKHFPSKEKVIQVFGVDEMSHSYHKVNVFAVEKLEDYKISPASNTFEEITDQGQRNLLIGGFFGGTVYGVNWLTQEFYRVHDEKMKENVFVGREEILLNWIATQNPERFTVVCSCLQFPWGECGNNWFYFQGWYGLQGGNHSICQKSRVMNMENFLIQFSKYNFV